jgi:hypothetical protein
MVGGIISEWWAVSIGISIQVDAKMFDISEMLEAPPVTFDQARIPIDSDDAFHSLRHDGQTDSIARSNLKHRFAPRKHLGVEFITR